MYWAGTGQEKAAAIPAHLPAHSQANPWGGSEWQCCGTAGRDMAETSPVLQFQRAASTGLGCFNMLCLSLVCHASCAFCASPSTAQCKCHTLLLCCEWDIFLLEQNPAVHPQSSGTAGISWWKSGFLYLNTAVHLLNRNLQSSPFPKTANFLLARRGKMYGCERFLKHSALLLFSLQKVFASSAAL